MDVISKLIARACEDKQRIVLPEGTEERTLKAADKAIADGIITYFSRFCIANAKRICGFCNKYSGFLNICLFSFLYVFKSF